MTTPPPASLDDERRLAQSCWYVTGATASGKSEIGICLAEQMGGEIIALDSMTIYRGMDVGTAKPTAEQRARVPHHLLDLVDPTESFSVSRYRELALQTIRDIQARGRQTVFVGGTALYLKALLRGLFQGPPADWDFREQIEAEVAQVGLEPLYQRLQQVDPLAAHKLHPRDKRRIIRALEVYRQTGKPISHWQEHFEFGAKAEECRVFAIRYPRHILHRRIEERVDAMFAAGLVEEVRSLLERFPQLSTTAMQAVGYREVIDHVLGITDLATTRERVLVRTRRFARHQETWFRGLTECRMLDLPEDASPSAVAVEIVRLATP